MRNGFLSFGVKTILLGGFLAFGLAGQATSSFAQGMNTAGAIQEPLVDLGLYTQGGAELEKAVYDLLMADPSLALGLEALLVDSNSAQKMAIGAAFGRAVNDLSVADADAAPILLAVSDVTDIDFLTSFAAGSGDAATAALGADSGVRGFALNGTAPASPFSVNGSSGVGNTGIGEGTGDANPNGLVSYNFGTIATANFTSTDAGISPITP